MLRCSFCDNITTLQDDCLPSVTKALTRRGFPNEDIPCLHKKLPVRIWRCREQVAPCLMSRGMSPQPNTPFFEIITIPISLYRGGMVMIGLRGVSRLDKSEKGAF
jgi:hypothetical protein